MKRYRVVLQYGENYDKVWFYVHAESREHALELAEQSLSIVECGIDK